MLEEDQTDADESDLREDMIPEEEAVDPETDVPPAEDEEIVPEDVEDDPSDDGDESESGEEDGDDEPETDEDEEGAENDGTEDEAADGVSPLPLVNVVEALLFAAREPLKLAQIARAAGKRIRQELVREAIDELNVQYLESARAFEIAEISGRYQLMSRPEYADYIMRIYPKRDIGEKEKVQRLTPAMLDTLAIVAYKQPVMRSEIEHIRGVACGQALRSLIERGSVKEIGRRTDLLGKPAVFGTTEQFLAEFGLGSLDELPMRSDFVAPDGPPPVELSESAPETDADADNASAEADESGETESVENAAPPNADDGDSAPDDMREAATEDGDSESGGEENADDDLSEDE